MRRDQGATLVEYALILAFVVVGSIGAINYLTAEGDDQIENSADCVSERPPPPSCQIRAVTTTSATTSPLPSTTLPPTTTTVPPSSQATALIISPNPTPAQVIASLTLTTTEPDGEGQPVVVGVAGAVVYFDIVTTAPGGNQVTTATCTSAADGSCSMTTALPYSDATSFEIRVVRIDSNPPVTTLPAGVVVTL